MLVLVASPLRTSGESLSSSPIPSVRTASYGKNNTTLPKRSSKYFSSFKCEGSSVIVVIVKVQRPRQNKRLLNMKEVDFWIFWGDRIIEPDV